MATPHRGASTEEAEVKVAVQLAEAVVEYFEKGVPRNALNLPAGLTPEMKPYMILANRLGRFAAQIVDGPIKKVTVHGAGTISRHNLAPIAAEAMAGILSSRTSGISTVN